MSFEQAREAFRKGGYAEALGLLTKEVDDHPDNVEAHLLLARCFLEGGQYSTAFQVCKALLLSPEIRLHAPLPRDAMEDLRVDVLLRWAAAIEQAGFPKDELETFGKAVRHYAEGRGPRSSDFTRLLDGLREGKFLTSMIADVVRRRS